jgi:hydrogenase-4 component F
LYADHRSALVIVLTASVALACSVYAVGYLREDERNGAVDETTPTVVGPKLRKYYVLTPLFVCSMLLVTVANNLGVMWAAIEATTLASVFLVTFGKVTS